MIGVLVPDAHVNQDQELSRFSLLGRMIADLMPDFIMTMGDFLGMHSLSHWDKNKRVTVEGRRYQLDIDLGNRALDLMLSPMRELDNYHPKMYYLMGNHEDWAVKFVEENPSMQGFVEPRLNLRLRERGFEVIPYKEYLELDGVLFTHVPLKGGQPVQGQYALQRAFEITSKPMVFGHLHRLELMHGRRLGAEKIPVLTTGCFFDEEYEEDFLKGCPNPYWRGVLIYDGYKYGQFDFAECSLDKLRVENALV